MSPNYYEQYLKNQKAMFDAWENSMKQMPFFTPDVNTDETENNTDAALFNPMEYYNKMMEQSKQMGEEYLKMFTDNSSVWENISEARSVYNSLFELWKRLSVTPADLETKTLAQIYDEWIENYYEFAKKLFLVGMPEYMKNLSEKVFDTAKLSQDVFFDYCKPWLDDKIPTNANFYEAVQNAPSDYVSFLKEWQKNYEETSGKFMKAPTYGKDRAFWEAQKASIDKFIKYSITLNEFNTNIYKIAQDATKKVMSDYAEMYKGGTQPKTFDEFYKYWASKVSEAYDKIFFSDDFSKLSGHIVDTMSSFKIEYDKLCESYLTNVPVPKKSEMDNLYKTVYELKKEVRALKKEVNTLKVAASAKPASKSSANK